MFANGEDTIYELLQAAENVMMKLIPFRKFRMTVSDWKLPGVKSLRDALLHTDSSCDLSERWGKVGRCFVENHPHCTGCWCCLWMTFKNLSQGGGGVAFLMSTSAWRRIMQLISMIVFHNQ